MEAANSKFRSGSSKTDCSPRCSSSALALAVSLDPPLDVVISLLKVDPAALTRPDNLGRFPLHIACSAGASVDVVHRLLVASSSDDCERPSGEGSLNAALCTDDDDRNPLHYAAEYATGSYGDALDVVAVLCAACPMAASAKDRWGETPSDVAAQMEEAALLDGDHEMVESARAVERVLWQTFMMPWKRMSKVSRREEMIVVGHEKLHRIALSQKKSDTLQIGPNETQTSVSRANRAEVQNIDVPYEECSMLP
eukprot:CAMPEP_0197465954 /NCGR_PEP_ID=MMETSP1175-20131217/64804_1 /TAXON_ID=1003142 /ORGANISM="Triceratium dubium, Strain CCMP147" /LENGTH=252 /DNA_ID=CAMNT_0043001981 /DNA_START=963 /DNA_END=1718 /DNA_ORIENTATION=+